MIQKLEQRVIGTDYGCSGATFSEVIDKVNEVIDYINSLPDENNPEPYNPVYDEDYLNGKIDKAKKSWEGVDVDKFMNEVRGRDEEPSRDLEEEVKRYYSDNFTYISSDQPTLSILTNVAHHFAEWQYQKDRREFAKLKAKEWSDGYDEGIVKGKEQMMKDAVEGFIFQSEDYYPKELVAQYNGELKHGDKVKIIIVKED